MTNEKWENVKGMVKDKFDVEEEGIVDMPDTPQGLVEFIIFLSPLGRIKLEYITRPVILDKKTIGSRRIGSETTVEYIYSEDEFFSTFKAYKWEDGDWVEMAQEKLGVFSA